MEMQNDVIVLSARSAGLSVALVEAREVGAGGLTVTDYVYPTFTSNIKHTS